MGERDASVTRRGLLLITINIYMLMLHLVRSSKGRQCFLLQSLKIRFVCIVIVKLSWSPVYLL